MPAYVFADVEITDPEKMKVYQSLAPEAIKKYGGRYLARGGEAVALEGEFEPHRFVIVEFPSLEAAQSFYNSPEYGKAKEARKGAGTFRMLAVEGL